MCNILSALIITLFCCFSSQLLQASGVSYVTNMKVEYTQTPLGMDVAKPRFSWQMGISNNERGYYQKAWQIVVNDEKENEVWNSGKQLGDCSLNIEYKGLSLKPMMRYYWSLKIWNQKNEELSGKSWFETGLNVNNTFGDGWSGAKWIGGSDSDLPLFTQYLPVFRLGFSVQLDKKSKSNRASFIYGANDERLMDKNKNLYHLSNEKNQSYIKVEIDIQPFDKNKEAMLNVYRVGYTPKDKSEEAFTQFVIPATFLNVSNKYAEHRITIKANLGETEFYVDNSDKPIGQANLNPLGAGGDFITFPVVGDYGYSVPEKQSATFSNVQVSNYRSPSNVIATLQQNDTIVRGTTSDAIITAKYEGKDAPMLRTVFSTKGSKISKARLYATARGVYEFYINGQRVGNDYLNPGLTQYNKTHFYQTYDVTDILKQGVNAMGAVLSEGWWSGGLSYVGKNWNFFGDRQSLLAKLMITYENGEEDILVTDPSTWQYYDKGPVVYGSLFQGEVYDASREVKVEGWTTEKYDASQWKQASEIPLDGTICKEKDSEEPAVSDYSNLTLTGQLGSTVKVIQTLQAQSVEEVRPGVFVYDMGQNMAGVPEIHLSDFRAGTKINLRFAEVKYPDLPEYKENVGMIMLENIRAAMAQDIYITKGGEEVFSPHFTYHGYRFVEITGIDKPLLVEAVKGKVLSSLHELASSYETSNAKVNRLWQNIKWSSFANFFSIPTDCPQRNERMGWAGDISVFSPTAVYLADMPQFLRKYLRDTRDVQSDEGRFLDVAPIGGGFGGILWGSAGITIPWQSYLQYGDKAMLAEHYSAMQHYIDYILQHYIDKETNILVQNRAWGDLTDWLGPEDSKNDKSLLWESYFIYDLNIMSKVAAILNKEADVQKYRDLCNQRKYFFNKQYFQPATGKTVFSGFEPSKKGQLVDTQTSYVLPLAFDIIESQYKKQFADNLIQTLDRENMTDKGFKSKPFSLMTGFIGTAWISNVLSEQGHSDAAYKLLQQTSYPSWLYSVEQGATTIWERLNSYTQTDGFGGNNRMNSFNHYSFGAVGFWMYNHSLGIQREESCPAFKQFILKPEVDPTGLMKYAKGHYDSMYGRIESSWRVTDNCCSYDFTIPCNTSALVYLPASSINQLKEGGKRIGKKTLGVRVIGIKNGLLEMKLESGKYCFEIEM